MEEKIIVINCHGSIEEIISSLKDIVSKLEKVYDTDEDGRLAEGLRLKTNSEKVVLTVLK